MRACSIFRPMDGFSNLFLPDGSYEVMLSRSVAFGSMIVTMTTSWFASSHSPPSDSTDAGLTDRLRFIRRLLLALCLRERRRQLCSNHNKVITVIDCQITLTPSRSIICCLYAMECGKAGIQMQSYVTLETLLLDFQCTDYTDVVSWCAYLVWPCLEVNPHDKA